MPEIARRYEQRYYYGETSHTCTAIPKRYPVGVTKQVRTDYPNRITPANPRRTVKRSVKKNSSQGLERIFAVVTLALLGLFVLPIGFKNIASSAFTKSPYPKIKADYKQIVYPTVNYLNNNLFLNELSLNGVPAKKQAMLELSEGQELTGLENELNKLSALYPTIHPSIYVWDYETGNFADINASEKFSAASIIKIPVLLQLFRSIELKQVSLLDEMPLTEYYRSEGSGSLQFKAHNSLYSIDTLARIMITESDNSATNMLMSKIGSMVDINQGIRDWGLNQTYVQTWLPDLTGTNYTTTRDLARMLYNIENPNFISPDSRDKIFDYMGHVKNNRLIQAGLGEGSTFLHKTGDIGKMLGDAGIVITPNNKKYIVAILANRPYNSPAGKDFIVKASEIIYNHLAR